MSGCNKSPKNDRHSGKYWRIQDGGISSKVDISRVDCSASLSNIENKQCCGNSQLKSPEILTTPQLISAIRQLWDSASQPLSFLLSKENVNREDDDEGFSKDEIISCIHEKRTGVVTSNTTKYYSVNPGATRFGSLILQEKLDFPMVTQKMLILKSSYGSRDYIHSLFQRVLQARDKNSNECCYEKELGSKDTETENVETNSLVAGDCISIDTSTTSLASESDVCNPDVLIHEASSLSNDAVPNIKDVNPLCSDYFLEAVQDNQIEVGVCQTISSGIYTDYYINSSLATCNSASVQCQYKIDDNKLMEIQTRHLSDISVSERKVPIFSANHNQASHSLAKQEHAFSGSTMLVKSLAFPSNLFPSFSASEIGTNQRWAPSKSSNSLGFSSKLQFLRKSTQNSSGVSPDDAVIIVDHGSRRQESNLMLNEFVEMFRHKTGYQNVEPAHMELEEPSIGDAFQSCVRQGAHRVIISPFFLGPGRHWSKDISSLSAEAAKQHPGVSYIVIAPLGLPELLVEDLLSIVDLKLVPWGNAKLRDNSTIVCQHGEDECLLDTVEGCAIDTWPQPKDHFPFIHCVEDLAHQGRRKEWESCYGKLGLDSSTVNDCYRSEHGKELHLKHKDETNALQPPHTYVPWVVVDGEPIYDDYRNFISYICNAYKGTDAPKSCTQTSYISIVGEVEAKAKHSFCVMEKVMPTWNKIRSTVGSWMNQMNLVGAI